jgi:hypothetical protein
MDMAEIAIISAPRHRSGCYYENGDKGTRNSNESE